MLESQTRSHQTAPESSHKKGLDSFGAICIVIGSILGSGIFFAPGAIASFSDSILATVSLWLIGGIACAIGASIYGSLAVMFPQGGGPYVYLRESLGESTSRMYGWASVLVICPAMLAGTSLFLAAQVSSIFPMGALLIKICAIGTIIAVTALNTRGIQVAGGLQKLLVISQVALFLAVLVLSALWLPGDQFAQLPVLPAADLSLAKGIVALAIVLWAFEGFNTATFITNEIEEGEKHIRRIGLIACAVIFVLYALFSLTALGNVSSVELQGSNNVAAILMSKMMGEQGRWLVLGLTILGIATSLQTSVIIGSRVTRAVAADGKLPTWLGVLDQKTNVPAYALWAQCAVVTGFIIFGNFASLITCFVVVNWIFYGLTAVGYLKLKIAARAVQIEKINSLKSKTLFALDAGSVVVFVLVVTGLLVSQIIESPRLATLGFVVIGLGIFGIGYFSKLKTREFMLADSSTDSLKGSLSGSLQRLLRKDQQARLRARGDSRQSVSEG